MNRVHVFQMFLPSQQIMIRDEIQKFMSSPAFEEAAQAVCGQDYPFRKQVQVNMNILLPGQLLPIHFDVPYFHGEQDSGPKITLNILLCYSWRNRSAFSPVVVSCDARIRTLGRGHSASRSRSGIFAHQRDAYRRRLLLLS